MPISSEHVKLLESYRDKAYITSILYAQSSEHFEFLRSIINIPWILRSSVMTVMNSMNESNSNEIKISNIVLNTWISLILSLVGNFKFTEKAINFKQIEIKMNKLTHKLEDFFIDLEITKIEDTRAIINEYDSLNESLDFPFPNLIKNWVKKIYSEKKTLPNILNCEISFVKVDEV